ncbi:MAG TPA: hypothetical protein VD866_32185, partial [Urbifossiella sp.]|nr:hypothetical protein [Urbifossiella sp.]
LAGVNPVVRNGVGDYSINFLAAFSSAYYTMIVGTTLSTGSAVIYGFANNLSAPTAGTGRVIFVTGGGVPAEAARVDLVFFGDQ